MTRLLAPLCCAFLLLVPGAATAEDQAEPVPLNQNRTVLLDKENGKILLKGEICLREGILEMFLCPKQTKEHESIVSLDSRISVIHAGLLALGAETGTPARFQPEHKPPTGHKIEIYVTWQDDENETHRMQAQQWIRHSTHRYFEAPLETVPGGVLLDEGDDSLRYDRTNSLLLWYGTMSEEKREELLAMSQDPKYRDAVQSLFEQGRPREMDADFVFVGSAFRTLEDGSELYLAEAGNAICVANFYESMIDVDVRSTASNDAGLLFEPYTERIPPVGTPVTVELIPVQEKEE